jgi:hypothetical protein
VSGLILGSLLEVSFDGVTWVDLTSRVECDISIRKYRTTEFDPLQGCSLEIAALRNDDGYLTPDNPLSPYYPNVTDRALVRYSVRLPSGAWTYRFKGLTQEWVADPLDSPGAFVKVSCISALAATEQTPSGNMYIASALSDLDLTSARGDAFELDDPQGASQFKNSRKRTSFGGYATLSKVDHVSQAGSVSAATVLPLMPAGLALAPADTGLGSVLALDLGQALGANVSLGFQYSSTASAAAGDLHLAAGYDVTGRWLWTWKMTYSAGHTILQFGDELAVSVSTSGAIDGDGAWRTLYMYWDGANAVYAPDHVIRPSLWSGSFAGLRLDLTRYVMFGGSVPAWQQVGKQTRCPAMQVSGISVGITSGYASLLDHTAAHTSASVLAWPVKVGGSIISQTFTDDNTVRYTYQPTKGVGGLTLIDTVARSGSLTVLEDFDAVAAELGTVNFRDYRSTDPTAVSFTVTSPIDEDLGVAPLTITRTVNSFPTRVTASSLVGSVTVVNTVAEAAGGQVREESTELCTPTIAQAASAAGKVLNRSTMARWSSVGVNLATSVTNLWGAFVALQPGQRVRLTGLPSALVGFTYRDGYLAGWTETITRDSQVKLLLDLTPADAPARAVLDDTARGRLAADVGGMTVTSGTAVGSTGNGTIVVTTTAGSPLTVDAGAYPMGFDWNGEYVTVTSAPASAVSPQTLTVTSRGVAPSVARSHSSNESINVYFTSALGSI